MTLRTLLRLGYPTDNLNNGSATNGAKNDRDPAGIEITMHVMCFIRVVHKREQLANKQGQLGHKA